MTSYNFLKIKSQIKSSKGKQSDLTIKKLKKKKEAGMGRLIMSNEIFFKSAPEKLTKLILMVLFLLLKDAIFHKVGAEV